MQHEAAPAAEPAGFGLRPQPLEWITAGSHERLPLHLALRRIEPQCPGRHFANLRFWLDPRTFNLKMVIPVVRARVKESDQLLALFIE
jgi:hypothetical protein